MNENLTDKSTRATLTKLRKKDLFSKAIISTDFSDIFVTFIGHSGKHPYHFWNTDYRTDYCLQYVIDGKGEFFTNNTLYKLKKNDLFLVPREKSHYYRSDKNDPYDLYYIHINGRGITNFFKHIQLSDETPIVSVNSDSLAEMFEDIILLAQKYGDTDKLLLLSKTYALLNEIASNVKKADLPLKTHEEKIIDTVIAHISEHFNEKILLDDIASLVHLNKSYLSFLFHKATGYSPIEYLINYRLNHARTLLSYDYTITEIAYMCGFCDVSNFSKCFKQRIGITPLAFRKDLSQSSEFNRYDQKK